MDLRINFGTSDRIAISTKRETIKDSQGKVVEHKVMTTLTFTGEFSPSSVSKLHESLKLDAPINVFVYSDQGILKGFLNEREK